MYSDTRLPPDLAMDTSTRSQARPGLEPQRPPKGYTVPGRRPIPRSRDGPPPTRLARDAPRHRARGRTGSRPPLTARPAGRRHDTPGEAARQDRPGRALRPRRPPSARHRRRLRHQRQDDDRLARGRHSLAARAARAQPLRRQPRLRRGLDAPRFPGRRARPVRGRRGSLPGRRPAPPAEGGLPRAISFATSSTATASWSRSPSAGAPPSESCPGASTLVVNADDPQVADLAAEREGSVTFGLDDPSAGAIEPPARRRLEVLPPLRNAVLLRRRLRRASRRLPLPELRSLPAPARDRRPRSRTRRARARVVRPRHAGGHAADRGSACRASTTSTTPSPQPRSPACSGRASTRSRRASPQQRPRSGGSSGSRSEIDGSSCS